MSGYRIAAYLRLSRAGEESGSIAMQRALLQTYAAENFKDYELLEFCDDGFTGTNFERPGIRELLRKAKSGEIDCIIVKDLSRFARDYIELGSYLEQIFPFLGIRFISVNDHYDSDCFQGSIAGIDVDFQNLLYDLYSKDLSGKVRSSLAARKESGQYVSANSPFGYEKDPEDRHALRVAWDEAEIVRRIFSLTLEGYTPAKIAKLFNETGIKTPIEFKIEKGKTKRLPKGERFIWSSAAICRILRNEIYIGNIVQKKYTRDFASGKNHLNPRENWLAASGHHEPVIGKEIFDRVQAIRGKKKPPRHYPSHPLVGKLVCGCCKRNLQYRRGLNPCFSCVQRYVNPLEGCVRKVNAMFLEQYVLWMLQGRMEAGEQPAELSKKTIERCLDKIVVYDERHMEIRWKETEE
ncbi:MAG: recombinase family protein [Blautia sp.]|nr:recombinase family protein [Blautia sp.]